MPLTVGGGVRKVEDVRSCSRGADKVSINTAAVNRRDSCKEAAEKFGDQCIVVAIDAKQVSQPGETAAGRSSPTAAATRPASMRWRVRARWSRSAPARSCSPRWTATAPSRYDLELTRAVADAVPSR